MLKKDNQQPIFGGNMKYTKEHFIALLQEKYNEPFEIIEYSGTSKSGKYFCGYCKKEYSLSKMGKLLDEKRKHLCSHCFESQYADEVLNIFKNSTDLIMIQFSYKQNLHKPTVIYKCKKCEEITEKPYVEFLKYPTCIHCGKNSKRRTTKSVLDLVPKDFTLLEEYSEQYDKKLFQHECGFIFKTRPKDLINGHTFCPKCSKKASKGERKIMEYLSQNNFNFTKEKIFNWSNQKRYDFFLPDFNLLSEYHGIQHYKEDTNFFLPLKEQQEIDIWKQNKAKENGYNYLIISYLEFDNIEKILAQRLKENT